VRPGRIDPSLRRYAVLCVGAVAWVGVMLRLALGTAVPGSNGEATKVAVAVAAVLLLVLALPVLFRFGRDGRREAAGHPHSRPPSLLEDDSVVMWTTDRLLRVMDAAGGGLGSRGLADGEVDGMPLAEFFEDLRPDSGLVSAHRRALAGERVSCSFRMARAWFQGVVQPLLREGRTVGVIGLATEEVVGTWRGVGSEKVIDLTNVQEDEAEVTPEGNAASSERAAAGRG
jgi:hypothetical protein